MAINYNSSLDTNAIVRLCAGDIPAQREKVIKLLHNSPDCSFFVCDVILAETVFILTSSYKRTRKEIRTFLTSFFSLPNVHPESSFVLDILDFYVEHLSLSFVDCYSAAFAEVNKKEPLLTFDKKLAKKHPSAKLIE